MATIAGAVTGAAAFVGTVIAIDEAIQLPQAEPIRQALRIDSNLVAFPTGGRRRTAA